MVNTFLKQISKGMHGTASEKRLGKEVGGKMTPGSGALQGAKGDVVLPVFLMECKATCTPTMSLQYSWLNKISYEAVNAGKVPALSVSFVDYDGKSALHGDWVMVPLTVFNELIHGR